MPLQTTAAGTAVMAAGSLGTPTVSVYELQPVPGFTSCTTISIVLLAGMVTSI